MARRSPSSPATARLDDLSPKRRLISTARGTGCPKAPTTPPPGWPPRARCRSRKPNEWSAGAVNSGTLWDFDVTTGQSKTSPETKLPVAVPRNQPPAHSFTTERNPDPTPRASGVVLNPERWCRSALPVQAPAATVRITSMVTQRFTERIPTLRPRRPPAHKSGTSHSAGPVPPPLASGRRTCGPCHPSPASSSWSRCSRHSLRPGTSSTRLLAACVHPAALQPARSLRAHDDRRRHPAGPSGGRQPGSGRHPKRLGAVILLLADEVDRMAAEVGRLSRAR